MDNIDRLILFIKKTNPEMTEYKLIKELSQNRYSTAGLLIAYKNSSVKG